MQIVRTILWVLILSAILIFSYLNWKVVEITLWDQLIVEAKVPALVIVAFLLGLVPMWLYHRSVTWSLNRRIRTLENSIKSSALAHGSGQGATPRVPPPVETSLAGGAPVDTFVDTSVGKPVETQTHSATTHEDSLGPSTSDKPA